MSNFKETIETFLKGKIHESGETDSCNVAFLEEVVAACKANYCGQYNKTWLCPPAIGSLEELKAKYTAYKKVFVFTTKSEIEDSFDIEGMFAARVTHDKITFDLKDELTKTGKDFKILGAGGCKICEKCAYPTAPCRFPNKAIPSVEACGIQVMQLSQTLKINYINGVNTVTYFSVVFYD